MSRIFATSSRLLSGLDRVSVNDGWNCLVEAKNGATSLIRYEYDGLTRRIEEGSTRQYFSAAWQVLEERNGSNQVTQSFAWSPVYVDAMIARDRNTVGNATVLEERLYALQDANFNVTAIADTSGNIVERYLYDAYGKRIILDGTFTAIPGNVSTVAFQYGHQGGEYDAVLTNTMLFRNRVYDVEQMRWLSVDPLMYIDGANLFQALCSNPLTHIDPTGLYDRGGHFWTVYAVAMAAGRSPSEAYQLAAYAQFPDQTKNLDAQDQQFKRIWEGAPGMPVLIQAYVHQLHGLEGDAIAKNRNCLAKLLKNGLWGDGKRMNTWERGVLIHAIGDSFAHTWVKNGMEQAYENHGIDGHWPDVITWDIKKYGNYIDTLFDSLGGNRSNAAQIALLGAIKTFTLTLPAVPPPIRDLGGEHASKETDLLEAFVRATFGYGGVNKEKYVPANGHDADGENAKFPFGIPNVRQLEAFVKRLKAACPCGD